MQSGAVICHLIPIHTHQCNIHSVNYVMKSICSNPTLVIDFDNLPKNQDDGNSIKNKTSPNFMHQEDNHISLIDRLDLDINDDNLLPHKSECGDGMQFVNRVFGGDFTSIWEFPWYQSFFVIQCNWSLYDFSLVLWTKAMDNCFWWCGEIVCAPVLIGIFSIDSHSHSSFVGWRCWCTIPIRVSFPCNFPCFLLAPFKIRCFHRPTIRM